MLKDPTTRAWFVAVFFSLAGLLSFTFVAPTSRLLWPNAIFYAVLVVNTFYSVRLFARIAPASVAQTAVDLTLVAAYVGLALSLGREWAFPFFALCIFVAAPIKYVLMLGSVPNSELLKKKLLIDLSGTVMSVFTLLGAIFLSYPLTAAWALAILFSLANIYLLAIRPMYRM